MDESTALKKAWSSWLRQDADLRSEQRGLIASAAKQAHANGFAFLFVLTAADFSRSLSLAEVNRRVRRMLADIDVDERLIIDTTIVVDELISNVLQHSYGASGQRWFVMRFECHPSWIRVSLADRGGNTETLQTALEANSPEPHHFGLQLIRSLTTSYKLSKSSPGTSTVIADIGKASTRAASASRAS